MAEYLRVSGEARAEIEKSLKEKRAKSARPKLGGKLVPLPLKLPAPAFRGTPVPLKEPNVEKPRGSPRPPFLAPAGTANLAAGRRVAASDPQPTGGELDFVVDGYKEASDFACLELHPGTQWVQIDLGRRAIIFAVLIWHNHAEARVYRDVIVQVSDDPDFIVAHTVFNSDHDNSSWLGTGKDKGYVETSEGKLIDCKGIEGRFVRLYSRGNHIDPKNHYTEVEVYGIPLE
ncbi:MAG TPA: discoidin domain-containing protein [Planctomycetaceae bacterium]|nr:discoidin domain-containing protein [Planctomycetaceae bacterium]